MSQSVFPIKGAVERPDRDPTVVQFDDADEMFAVLASETARAVVSAVSEDPATASELADRLGSSIQNVTYHLDRLTDAGILTVVDFWYSSRGQEMDVYALDAPLVIRLDDGSTDENNESNEGRAPESRIDYPEESEPTVAFADSG